MSIDDPSSSSVEIPAVRNLPVGSQPEHQHHAHVAPGRILATAIVLVICYYAELPIVVLLASILLAFVLTPAVDFFMWMRMPRALAAFVALLLLILVMAGPVYLSYIHAQDILQQLPVYRRQIQKSIGHVEEEAATLAGDDDAGGVTNTPAPASASAPVSHRPVDWPRWLTSSLGSITEVAFSASLIPFLVYFMITWQQHVRAATVMLFKLENRNTAYVTLGLISSMIRAFIMGNIVIGLVVSVFSTAVFAAIGLPYSYLLGFLSGYASLLPYVGIPLAILPPVTVGLGQVHSTEFAIIVVTVIGLHLTAMNVLYPKLLGNRLQLNPLAVTLSLLFWGWLWGAMGLILAMPITAALKIVFDHVEGLRPYGTWLGV
ncbi:MAG: AI-2E family transporter [Terriglobales bacterium]